MSSFPKLLGPASSGTLSYYVLVPTFIKLLHELDPYAAFCIVEQYVPDEYCTHEDSLLFTISEEHTFWKTDTCAELLDELCTALDKRAPYGYFFGTNPLDATTFGFWKTEDTLMPISILNSYLTALLWSSLSEDDQPLDENYDFEDIAPITKLEAREDITQFLDLANEFVPDWPQYWTNSQLGLDFWLTRNGHGAGFWDRYSNGKGALAGDRLTKIAKTFGSIDPYVGNDGLIYC